MKLGTMDFYTLPSGHRLRALCWFAAACLGAVRLSQITSLGEYHRHDQVWEVAPFAETQRSDQRRDGRLRRHGDTLRQRTRRVVGLVFDERGLLVSTRLPHVKRKQAYAKLERDSVPRGNAWEIKPVDGGNYTAGEERGRCGPMHAWQTRSFPNCNNVHELDMTQMRKINSGGFRTAYEMHDYVDGKETKFVYKTIKHSKSINGISLRLQRIDALVLERTTSSPFVPDIHGFCGLAALMDYMPEGNMHDYIKGARLAGGSPLAPVDRLRIALHTASGVAALHAIDGTTTPSFFHNDVFPHQFLFQEGRFKLNDFHVARPILADRATGAPCAREGFGVQVRKKRSLEQHQQASGHPDFRPVPPDKTDVWMMGNVMYTVLTDWYLFEKPRNLNCTEAGRELMAGRRSPYPEDVEHSKDPAIRAMKRAVDLCWTQAARERPSAQAVADYLMQELKAITGEEEPDLRVTLPERDPDQSMSSSDYNLYNYDWALALARKHHSRNSTSTF